MCFIDCKAFGRQAEIVSEYVRKGNPLFVEGRLSFYQYETESGENRNKLSVIAERVQLMGNGMAEGLQSSAEREVSKGDDTAPGESTATPPDNMKPVDGEAEQPPPEPNGHERSSETEDDIPF